MYYEYFPPVAQALQEEIQKHERLLIQLCQLPKDAPLEMKLGEVAAYVGIILDGFYDAEQVEQLCDEIVRRLKRARGELVLEVASSIPPMPPHTTVQ